MCGRYVLKAEKEEIEKEFDAVIEETNQAELNRLHFNIAPSQIVLAVRQFENKRVATGLKWGLIPSWAKEESIANRMINARSESLTEKPSFRNAFRSRRCIIPASGFYEWKRMGEKSTKQPFYFHLKNKPVFGFAGLWESWKDETGEEIESCTIITTEANAVLAPVHNRMPVIIKNEDYEEWLDPKNFDTDVLQKFLKPFASYEMQSHAVSKRVNNPSSNEEGLINPIELNSL